MIGEVVQAAVEAVLYAIPWPNWMWTVAGVAAFALGVGLFWFAPPWVAGVVAAFGLLMVIVGIYSKD